MITGTLYYDYRLIQVFCLLYFASLFNIFRADVSFQPPAVFSVLDRLTGTAADTGHTVGTVLSPDRLPIFKTDIVQRTDPDAFSTGNAGIGGTELFCMYKQYVKQVVCNAAAHLIRKCHGWLR